MLHEICITNNITVYIHVCLYCVYMFIYIYVKLINCLKCIN